MKCPCKGCEDRTILCHGRCDGYQQWKAEREEINKWLAGQRTQTSEAGLKGKIHKLKTGKSRKWNVKNQYNRGDS